MNESLYMNPEFFSMAYIGSDWRIPPRKARKKRKAKHTKGGK